MTRWRKLWSDVRNTSSLVQEQNNHETGETIGPFLSKDFSKFPLFFFFAHFFLFLYPPHLFLHILECDAFQIFLFVHFPNCGNVYCFSFFFCFSWKKTWRFFFKLLDKNGQKTRKRFEKKLLYMNGPNPVYNNVNKINYHNNYPGTFWPHHNLLCPHIIRSIWSTRLIWLLLRGYIVFTTLFGV